MIAFHWLVIKIGPKWLNWNSLSLISYSVPLCIKLRASTVVLSMWTCKNIFHIQVELCTVFATPPINLNLGQQIDWGLLVANHLDQSLWWANEKHWAAVRSHVLHSFQHVHRVVVSFTSHGKLCNHTELKPFSCFHPILEGRIHLLSTAGDSSSYECGLGNDYTPSCVW